MEFTIAVIKGDGIGPEVVNEALRVLDRVGTRFGHTFHYTELLAGGCAIDACGVPLPEETLTVCLNSDSVLLGAVGGEKWESLPGELRPERALLGLRSGLALYANIRPAALIPALRAECPLRADIAENGFDMVIVRELTGGIYFGERGRIADDGGPSAAAYDVEKYSRHEVERIGRIAFETAAKRRKNVVSVDKANVLESSRLWREEMHKLKKEYPNIAYRDMFVDNAAMQLVRDPAQFDVVVTTNMFGDILSDEASMITGSIGLLASASLGAGLAARGYRRGMYEPIHGSAPDIAGQGRANPIAAILSAAMMLKYSFDLPAESAAVENAVSNALDAGWRTADIAAAGSAGSHNQAISTSQMTDHILEYL